MCGSNRKQKKHKPPIQKGCIKGFFCKDLYAEEVRFNIKGHTEIPSCTGQFLSFFVRSIVIAYIVERLLAWHSFDKFKITTYEQVADLSTGSYTPQNLNFKAQDFEIVIGFDRPLLPQIGGFEFNMLTHGQDGSLLELEQLASYECPWDHPGVAYAERELKKQHQTQFTMMCLIKPQHVGITGNKHSDFKHQTVSVSFARCSASSGVECWDPADSDKWLKNASLLLFTPQHTPMMQETAAADTQASTALEKSVYMYSNYRKQIEKRIGETRFSRATMWMKLNEIKFYDDTWFPAFKETTQASFFSIDQIETQERGELQGKLGEPLYEVNFHLAPLKTIHERSHTSLLFLGGLVVCTSLCLFYLIEIVYQTVSQTQGSRVHQYLLWGMYQIRRTKTIAMRSRAGNTHDPLNSISQTGISIDQSYASRNDNYDANQVRQRRSDKTKDIVEEIMTRQRYRYKVRSICSRFITFCLRNEDEHMQKVKINGEKRLAKEMDFTWILRQVRQQKALFDYLLTDRERLLLRFNDKHVIDSDTDMDDLKGSGEDLMKAYKEIAKQKNTDLRSVLAQQLKPKRGARKCEMYKRLDDKLELHVGRYRQGGVDVDEAEGTYMEFDRPQTAQSLESDGNVTESDGASHAMSATDADIGDINDQTEEPEPHFGSKQHQREEKPVHRAKQPSVERQTRKVRYHVEQELASSQVSLSVKSDELDKPFDDEARNNYNKQYNNFTPEPHRSTADMLAKSESLNQPQNYSAPQEEVMRNKPTDQKFSTLPPISQRQPAQGEGFARFIQNQEDVGGLPSDQQVMAYKAFKKTGQNSTM